MHQRKLPLPHVVQCLVEAHYHSLCQQMWRDLTLRQPPLLGHFLLMQLHCLQIDLLELHLLLLWPVPLAFFHVPRCANLALEEPVVLEVVTLASTLMLADEYLPVQGFL